MSAPPEMLQVRGLRVRYDGGEVLHGINLAVASGEFLGLVGPNGSGKSTLVRAVSRVLSPSGGSIVLDGRDLGAMGQREVARRVAVVAQEPAPPFDYSALEIVLMGRSPHLGRFAFEGERDFAVAAECLQATRADHLAARAITALSGGERQRVMIARALAQEPRLLILDEPTAHLDINLQIEVMDLVRRLNCERGLTVIAVLHDLNLAAQYCQRLVLLREGHLAADGPPAEVITPENVLRAYGTQVEVKRHPATGRPYLTLLSRLPAPAAAPAGMAVHVICGAGTGAALLDELVRRGYTVSAGVVNIEDSDQIEAERLGIERVEEAPFSPVSDEAHARNRDLAERADAVVVTAIPVGHGNLRNLEAAEAARRAGKRVIVVDAPPMAERDFVEGRAAAMQARLVEAGAEVAGSVAEALDRLERGRAHG